MTDPEIYFIKNWGYPPGYDLRHTGGRHFTRLPYRREEKESMFVRKMSARKMSARKMPILNKNQLQEEGLKDGELQDGEKQIVLILSYH